MNSNQIPTGQNFMANILRLAAEFDVKRQRELSELTYLVNSSGDAIPIENVRPRDIRADRIVKIAHLEAEFARNVLQYLKSEVYTSIEDQLEYMAREYDIDRHNEGGNQTLSTYDNNKKIEVRVQKKMEFGSEIQLAKELIDDCLNRWSEGANRNLKAVVMNAFKVDQSGKVDRNAILNLRNLEIDDEKWNQAMDLISDALHEVGSKSYVRFRQRVGEERKWESISIDINRL